jgi:uncharacterized membrane protein YgcG
MYMHTLSALTAVLAFGFMSTAAHAGGWGDFEAAFPLVPCQDGWVGCVVDGDAVTPDMVRGSDKIRRPADLRVDWFSLKGTSSFSPFPGLSEYTGALAGADDEEDATADDDGADDDGADDDGADDDDGAPEPAPAPAGGSRSNNSGSSSSGSSSGSSSSGSSSSGSRNSGSSSSGSSSSGGSRQATEVAGSGSGTADAGEGNSVISELNKDPVPSAGAGDCTNLRKLEPQAMLGKLNPEQAKCLEGRIADAAKQTDKDKISRVLMTNAYSSGDKKEWEKLIKRHLDEIDRSDPDLCYKYARHLSKKGPGSSYGVIKWADTALENRTMWTGSTYTSRVNSLYKLKAASAQKLWINAEKDLEAGSDDKTKAAQEKTKNMTKVFAREWYEYAKSAGKNANPALQLCISAAGTEDYCEAG